MLTIKGLKEFKEKIAPVILESVPGLAFGITDTEKIIEKITRPDFDVPFFQVGQKINQWGDRGANLTVKEGKPTVEVSTGVVFGLKIVIKNIPYYDEDGNVAGALTIVSAQLHPIAKAFEHFAPIMSELFSEGAVIYMTDKEKIVNYQNSKKWGIPNITTGTMLKKEETASLAMQNKKVIAENLGKEIYGIPATNFCSPLYDEQSKNEVIGSFGIIMPRENAYELHNIAKTLSEGLGEIASIIEQLAASASEVSITQKLLNNNIKDVVKLSEEINSVLAFIKQIADETKMLGLNAAIEAARAGEHGRGFGVVAEEIRKLSDVSKQTVENIRGLTKKIQESLEDTNNTVDVTTRTSEEQAAATQEITASIVEITAIAEKLERISQKM